MAELLIRYAQSKRANQNVDQANMMAIEITNAVLAITKLKELPREVRRFYSPVDQPDFHARITFLELEVTRNQMCAIRKECLVLMQKYATIGKHVRIVVVREEGESAEGMGNLTSLS